LLPRKRCFLPDTITADERKLKQVMYNLLSNAVKFTPDGGEVSLTAQTFNLEDEEVSAIDNDNGSGIMISVTDPESIPSDPEGEF